jgi:hypothetical protein
MRDATAVADCLSLLRFLLDSGANPNVHRVDKGKSMLGGTALDMFACFTMSMNRDPGQYELEELLSRSYTLLLDNDGVFSRPLQGWRAGYLNYDPTFSHFRQEVQHFKNFPAQFEGIYPQLLNVAESN